MSGSAVEGFKKGRVPRDVRVKQLLDEAERLFIERGFERMSIEELCRAADVSRPVVYEHFGSKEGVYLAAQRRIRAELEEKLGAAADVPDLTSALRVGATAFFEMVQADPGRWAFAFGTVPGGFSTELSEQIQGMRSGTAELLATLARVHEESLGDETIDALAHALSGAAESLGYWWLRNEEVPIERVVDYLVTTFSAAAQAYRRR